MNDTEVVHYGFGKGANLHGDRTSQGHPLLNVKSEYLIFKIQPSLFCNRLQLGVDNSTAVGSYDLVQNPHLLNIVLIRWHLK